MKNIKILFVVLVSAFTSLTSVQALAQSASSDADGVQPLPVNVENERWRFTTGERAYNLDRDSVLVTIMGVEAAGTYILRFEEGPLTGQIGGKWAASSLAKLGGCGARYCVGQQMIINDRDYVRARVAGIQADGNYVLEFLEGALTGKRGGKWQASSLSRMNGCGTHYCMGEILRNTEREYVRVRIVAIQEDDRYVLEFLEGPLVGRRGGKWNHYELARSM